MRPAEIAALLRPSMPRLPSTADLLARRVTIEDLRRAARRRMPRAVFDYIDGGAEDEVTMRRNREGFSELELVPRMLRDVETINLTTEVLGVRSRLPLALSPTGFTRMMHAGGELAVARAAARAGIPYTLSTMGTTSMEDVATASDGPLWFQLYVWRDRGLSRELIDRAKAAGYRALLLTVDTAVPGARERDLRNGLTIPPQLRLATVLDGARHPTWWWGLLRGDPVTFANVSHVAAEPTGVMAFVARQFDPTVTWDDIAWMVEAWDGPFAVKGVLSADDARRAAALGVQGVVVSNHGGRQLDHSRATISALTEVVDAVGNDLEVLVDSGFRRGSDVAKALAVGARAVMIGRPYLYGLGAAGEAGVDRAITVLAGELGRTMQLLGASSLAELDRSLVRYR
jgi:L-lactate dehydrogenase (cytochrome)